MDTCEQAAGCKPSYTPQFSAAVGRLPDEVLLMVMQYLDVEDLLSCRLVCKRSAALAVDPAVWRHRDRGEEDDLRCAALRLAPCLNSLSVYAPTRKCHRRRILRTKCALRELTVSVLVNSGVQQTVDVIRNQETLGRLRVVNIIIHMFPLRLAAATTLLETLSSISGLEELSIGCYDCGIPEKTRPILRSVSRPSLKVVRFEWSREEGCKVVQAMKDVCRFLLTEHAATLERVEFEGEPILARPASLLAGMPNLRVLNCEAFPGMKSLSASLTKLELHVTPETVSPDTRQFLRRGEQLRDVILGFGSPGEDDDHDSTWQPTTAGVDLVEDLASSGRPSLESLYITNMGRYFPQAQSLVRALPFLTSLRYLHVEVAPDELLLGITPTTAPALQHLEVGESNWGCTHAWLHRKVAKKLLSLNPSLHVSLAVERALHNPACSYCKVCLVYDCHPRLCKFRAVFFTHDPQDKCSLPEIHQGDSCYHVSDVSALEETAGALHHGMRWRDLAGRYTT